MGSKTAKRRIPKTSAPATEPELSGHLWSVISFERCEASGLTYNEAASKQKELLEKGVPGLCIVTDIAAKRLASK